MLSFALETLSVYSPGSEGPVGHAGAGWRGVNPVPSWFGQAAHTACQAVGVRGLKQGHGLGPLLDGTIIPEGLTL